MADQFDFWRAALADPAKIGTAELPIHDGDFESGYFQMRDGRGASAVWKAVMIVLKDGDLICEVNGVPADAMEIWAQCCRYPIPYKVYLDATKNGWALPSDPPAERRAKAEAATANVHAEAKALLADRPKQYQPKDSAGPAQVGPGHNLPDDPKAALDIEYQGEIETIKAFLATPIDDQETADRAGVWAKRLAGIAARAVDLHKVEKAPALKLSREIDDKWRDLKERPGEWATKLKRHADDFLNKKRREEEQRRAAAEVEKRRLELEAEQARRAAEQSGGDVDAEAEAQRLADEAAKAAREAEVRPTQAGRTGAKISLRAFRTAKIVDFDKLVDALKTHPEFKEFVQTLADRAAVAQHPLDGMEIITDHRSV